MASRIFAIDLGATSVKLAIATPGMRGATVTDVVERIVPGAEAGPPRNAADVAAHAQRAIEVVAALVREHHLGDDTGALLVNGDAVFGHVLSFPFATLRRAELVRAVGAELESVLPIDLEDMVYAFEPLPPAEAVDGKAAATGLRVMTHAMRKDAAMAQLDALAAAGVSARHLVPASGAAVQLVSRVAKGTAATIAVVDLGHQRTDMVVVRAGRATYARGFARAGRAFTEAIARAWQLSWADAERAKHADGFVASSSEPAPSQAWAQVSAVLAPEAQALARELRQSLSACRAKTGDEVGELLLVGGGARLRGLANFLAEQLGLPTRTLSADDRAALLGVRAAGAELADAAAITVALALDAAGGRPTFDLRQGELAAKVDLSFLRSKAVPLAAAALVVLAFAAGAAFFRLRALRHAEEVLAKRLAADTTAHYKEPRTASQVLNEASGVAVAAGTVSPVPKVTAYDLVLDLTRALPARDKVTIDVAELSITDGDPDRIVLKGTAKTLEEISLLGTELKKVECIAKGKVETGDNPVVKDNLRQFAFTISGACL